MVFLILLCVLGLTASSTVVLAHKSHWEYSHKSSTKKDNNSSIGLATLAANPITNQNGDPYITTEFMNSTDFEGRPTSIWGDASQPFMAIGNLDGSLVRITEDSTDMLLDPMVSNEETDEHAIFGITSDGEGNIYYSQYYHCIIRKIDIYGDITHLAGDFENDTMSSPPICGYSGDGQVANESAISFPGGLQYDFSLDALVFSDHGGMLIRRFLLNEDGAQLETVAGKYQDHPGFSGDGGPAIEAELGAARYFWLSREGDIFIADSLNHRIRMVSKDTGIITSLPGQFDFPYSITGDNHGYLYITSANPYFYVDRIKINSTEIVHFAGTGIDQRDNIMYDNFSTRVPVSNASFVVFEPHAEGLLIAQEDKINILLVIAESVGTSTHSPTAMPIARPTVMPTATPISMATDFPTVRPSHVSSKFPTAKPSAAPSELPTTTPIVTDFPTVRPSAAPSKFPTATPIVTDFPTVRPSAVPSELPTATPIATDFPTVRPSAAPSELPTTTPIATDFPTVRPSAAPSELPTATPIATDFPSGVPSAAPSQPPTIMPSYSTTSPPSAFSSHFPTTSPSAMPSSKPSLAPSRAPSVSPTVFYPPTVLPSATPTCAPTLQVAPIIALTANIELGGFASPNISNSERDTVKGATGRLLGVDKDQVSIDKIRIAGRRLITEEAASQTGEALSSLEPTNGTQVELMSLIFVTTTKVSVTSNTDNVTAFVQELLTNVSTTVDNGNFQTMLIDAATNEGLTTFAVTVKGVEVTGYAVQNPPDYNDDEENKKDTPIVIIVGAVVGGCVAVLLLLGFLIYYLRGNAKILPVATSDHDDKETMDRKVLDQSFP